MAKLVYQIAVTLDHFIADSDGNADNSIFLYEGDHVADFFSDIRQYDAVLMGGKTYAYGFQFGLQPGEPGYKGLKHFVFSKTLKFESNEHVELVSSDAEPYIENLKRTSNGSLWLCGGAQLAGSLIKRELIDQIILKVNPVMLGTGIPLFGDFRPRLKLELVDSVKYVSGVVKSTYNVVYP